MTGFGLTSRLSGILNQEIEGQALQLSSYSMHRMQHIVGMGVERMSLVHATEMQDKVNLAENNIKHLVEYLADKAKDYGSYPAIKDSVFDTAMSECYPLWPYC